MNKSVGIQISGNGLLKKLEQSEEKVRSIMEKQQYKLFGNHGGVKTCHYTKSSLHGGAACYKQQFYGIQSHQCIQMSPAVDLCNYNCTFCWRPMDYAPGHEIPWSEADDPKMLVEKSIEAQIKQLIGFNGDPNTNPQKVKEMFTPKHVAISLSGEPTLYPRLGEMIAEYHKRGITTFLVTNGSNPEALQRLMANGQEPTQLYISLSAPNEQLYYKIDRSTVKNGWLRLAESIGKLKQLKCRTVIRLTLVREAMIQPENYAELIKIGMPMFVEVKGYSHVGFSTFRLEKSEMPIHEEICAFAKEISALTDYVFKDAMEESRVALLVRPDISETKIDFSKYSA